jgi:hypothetical protein
MAIGLTLGVSTVRVVLVPPGAADDAPGPWAPSPTMERHLDTLAELGVAVRALPGCAVRDREVARCSSRELDELILTSGATLAW